MKKSSILFPGIITVHREIKLKNQIKLIFQIYTELELLKVAAGTFDPAPTLLGLILQRLILQRLILQR